MRSDLSAAIRSLQALGYIVVAPLAAAVIPKAAVGQVWRITGAPAWDIRVLSCSDSEISWINEENYRMGWSSPADFAVEALSVGSRPPEVE